MCEYPQVLALEHKPIPTCVEASPKDWQGLAPAQLKHALCSLPCALYAAGRGNRNPAAILSILSGIKVKVAIMPRHAA